ncbi:MAG: competence/damage-inducible protein A [Chlorobi bacterium]|nr:competence/damage-inducible protein A [Chlorobiota bacterium]
MKADIITIGDELLIGQITDTNSQWIAEQLNLIGFEIRQITSVSDDKKHIKKTLDDVLDYANLVVITGGLGPTEDDLTKETLAEYFNSELKLNEDVLQDVKDFVQAKGFDLNERNIKQAEVPTNCKVLRNKNGTAPGMWFEKNEKVIISLPAVPFEMKELVERQVIPKLKDRFKLSNVIHKTILTYGIPESSLAEILSDWEQKLHKKIKLAYLPSPERIRLRFSMVCDDKEKANSIINKEIEKLKGIIGKAIFGEGDMYLEEAVGKLLKEKGATLSVAESCTAGNVSRLIASIPGSSEYFKGGVVSYSNEIKNKQLGVAQNLLDDFGAVSKQVVEAMVTGQRELFDTDFSIAISGIAGPGGGTAEKPVGTTWIAVASKDGVISKKYTFGKRRLLNVRFASSKALDMLRKYILGYYED